MTGAGDGPMSNMMEPRPRDYRHGVFKFTSVSSPARPRREDLRRTLEHGLPGTQMAAWRELLGTGEREALIDRVRWIAIRGEVERWLVASWIADEERPGDAIEEAYREIWSRWLTANEHFVALQDPIPPADAASIERGNELFHDASRGNCASCHGDGGRGDGPSAVEVTPDGVRHSLLLDEWGRPAWPRDLRTGIFRGGSRPIDIYRRVHCGIHGTPMPAQAGTLSQDEIWDVVHYVRSIAGLK
jgi:mono/diheme cytochrome c family protein